jgi:hypothetical protein
VWNWWILTCHGGAEEWIGGVVAFHSKLLLLLNKGFGLHALVLPVWNDVPLVGALVENMVKKNRNRFLIVVLLTTLICSH